MKKRIIIAVAVFLILFSFLFSGCAEEKSSSDVIVFDSEGMKVLNQNSELILDVPADKVGILFISSEKHYWSDRDPEIKKELGRIISSGEYEILAIKTIYGKSYLIAVEIYYKK